MEKDSLFSKWCWENRRASGKTGKLDHCLPPDAKTHSKWIKDLNIRPETMRLLEQNIVNKVRDIGLGDDFLNFTLKAT